MYFRLFPEKPREFIHIYRIFREFRSNRTDGRESIENEEGLLNNPSPGGVAFTLLIRGAGGFFNNPGEGVFASEEREFAVTEG